MKRTCLIGILVTSLILLTTSGQVWSASITVLNPGFEDNVLSDFDNVRLSAVPLPAALPLFSGGLALLGFAVRRRAKVR